MHSTATYHNGTILNPKMFNFYLKYESVCTYIHPFLYYSSCLQYFFEYFTKKFSVFLICRSLFFLIILVKNDFLCTIMRLTSVGLD